MTKSQRQRANFAAMQAAARTVIDFEHGTVYTLPASGDAPQPRTTSRPRERRAHRSAKVTRASADDDPGEPAPDLAAEVEQFCRALLSDLRALRAVAAEVCQFDNTARYAVNQEVEGIRERVEAYVDALAVERAVAT